MPRERIVILVLALALMASTAANLVLHRRDTPAPTDCDHHWGIWDKPVKGSDWWNGTYLIQNRRCTICGAAEARYIQVSAHATP